MDLELKKHYVRQADFIVSDPVLQDAIEEFAKNMGFKLEGLPAAGLYKIAHYAAQVALAYKDGYTSKDLSR